VKGSAGDHADLKVATDLVGLLEAYEEAAKRDALKAILRGGLPSFKSARDQRLICEALPTAPVTAVAAMAKVHDYVDAGAGGEHAL
jgi:hypothetical protein